MCDSINTASLTNRVIRFLKQQRELYGDFSIKPVDLNSQEEPIVQVTELSPSPINENIEHHVESKVKSDELADHVDTTNGEQTTEERIAACSNVEALNKLYSEIINSSNDFVFGEGINSPKVMIIGGAPGKNDFKNGHPFSGKVGELLDKILAAISLQRSDLFLSNVLKFRPSKNELSKVEFTQLNTSFILKEIEIIQPKVVLCVGELATQTLLNDSTEFENLRGRLHSIQWQDYFATYHPAQLLLDESLKRPCWEDLKKLKAHLDS